MCVAFPYFQMTAIVVHLGIHFRTRKFGEVEVRGQIVGLPQILFSFLFFFF